MSNVQLFASALFFGMLGLYFLRSRNSPKLNGLDPQLADKTRYGVTAAAIVSLLIAILSLLEIAI